MNRIILASHGGMSAGVLDTAQMILGELPRVYAVAMLREDKESILGKVQRLMADFDAQDTVYLVTDVLGGSVNNDLLSLAAAEPRVTLLCGMNLCLVLGLATAEEPLSPEELNVLLGEARAQLANCKELLQNAEAEEDDL